MTQGPLARSILIFSLPLILSNLLQVLFNMSDVAVVGRFAGSDSLGAVGCTSQFVYLFTSFLIGMGSGINVLVARHAGSGHQKNAQDTASTALTLSLGLGVCITLLGIFFSRPILTLFGTRPELMDKAVLYVRIYFLGAPGMALYNYGNAVYDAIGNTRKPLLCLAFSGVLNILLNLFLVIVCRLDVAGVAIASAVSQLTAALLLLFFLRRDTDLLRAQAMLRPSLPLVRRLLSIGLSSGFQMAVFPLANLFIQSGVNSFDAVMVAGNAAAANADGIVYDVMAAFYTACASFMGQNYGAGKTRRVRQSFRISLAFSFGIGLFLGLALYLAGPLFLSLFTTDPAVVACGMERMRIMCFSYAVSAFMDCTIAASRSLGYTGVPTFIVIMGSCVFRILWVKTIFAHFHTIPSLYLLYIFSWALTAAFELLYFFRVRRHALDRLEKGLQL